MFANEAIAHANGLLDHLIRTYLANHELEEGRGVYLKVVHSIETTYRW